MNMSSVDICHKVTGPVLNQSIYQSHASPSGIPTAESFVSSSSPPVHIETIINNRIPSKGATRTEQRQTDNLVHVRKSPGSSHFKSVKFGVLNVRSIGTDAKSGQINDFALAEGLDCLALTETWLRSDDRADQQIGDISLNGFTFHHKPRDQRRGGGVGILTKSLLKVRALPHKPHTSFESIEASIATSKSHVHLVVVYRPPPSKKNKLTVASFLAEFTSYLETIVLTPGHLLIMGDFNFHVDSPSASPASKFSDILNQFNLVQHVTQPTHTSGHTLDLVITRLNDSLIHDLIITDPRISDHMAVIVQLHLSKPTPVKKTINYRNISKIKVDDLIEDLNKSLLVGDPPTDIQLLVNCYDSELTRLLDLHAPMRTKQVTEHAGCKWFTGELGEL